MAKKNPPLSQSAQDIDLKIQQEINKLSGIAKQDLQDQYDIWKKTHTKVTEYNDKLKEIKQTVNDLKDDLSFTQSIFEKIVDQLQKGNKALQFQETLISKAADIARETLEIRKGETFADASYIKSLQRKVQFELHNLNTLKTAEGLNEQQITDINNQIDKLKSVGGELDGISSNYKNINKDLGFTGQAAGLLGKVFQKIGIKDIGLTEAFKQTHMMGQAAKAAGAEFNAMKTFTKALGGEMSSLVGGPIGLLLITITEIVKAFKLSDKAAGDLAKDFNITYNEANRVRETLTDIAQESGDAAVNTRALQESMVAVGKSLGSNAMLNKEDLIFMTKLREQAGFTNEEIIGIEKTTLATGRNLEDNVESLLYAAKTTGINNGVLLNEKDIMRDISKASDAIKLSVGGSGKALGAAAAQARALGMELSQVDKIAESLLDFESSIANELSAELVTGKDLNLEQARLYALNNDIEGLSREIAKNYGSAAEFSQMNRIQQEYAAKAVGMSRDELAKTLTDAEALRGLSSLQAEDAKAALAAARARGMSEEEIAKKGIEDLMNQQSVQERLTQSVEKMKEVFVGIVEAFSPILDVFANLVAYISQSKLLLLAFQTIIAGIAVKSLVAAIASIFTGSAVLGPIGLGIAAAGTAALMAYVSQAKAAKMKNGGEVPPNFPNDTYPAMLSSGETVLPKPIPLSSVLMKTNINPNINKSTPPQQYINEDKLIKGIANVINTRPTQTSVNVDGDVLARANGRQSGTFFYTANQNMYSIS